MTKLLERGPAEDAAQFFDVMRAIERLERYHMHLEENMILPAVQSALLDLISGLLAALDSLCSLLLCRHKTWRDRACCKGRFVSSAHPSLDSQ